MTSILNQLRHTTEERSSDPNGLKGLGGGGFAFVLI